MSLIHLLLLIKGRNAIEIVHSTRMPLQLAPVSNARLCCHDDTDATITLELCHVTHNVAYHVNTIHLATLSSTSILKTVLHNQFFHRIALHYLYCFVLFCCTVYCLFSIFDFQPSGYKLNKTESESESEISSQLKVFCQHYFLYLCLSAALHVSVPLINKLINQSINQSINRSIQKVLIPGRGQHCTNNNST